MTRRKRKTVANHDDEQEAWSGGYSIYAFYANLVLLGLGVLLIGIVLLCISSIRNQQLTWIIFLSLTLVGAAGLFCAFLYNRFGRWYVVTNERLIHREGIFVRRHHILELIRIDDVTFEQGPIETLMGCGTIFVSSSDSSHPELEIEGIERVQEVAELIDSLRRQERKTRGLHVESI